MTTSNMTLAAGTLVTFTDAAGRTVPCVVVASDGENLQVRVLPDAPAPYARPFIRAAANQMVLAVAAALVTVA